MLLNQISEHFKKEGSKEAAAIFARKADMTTKRARVIHDSVFKQEIFSEDLRYPERKTKKRTKKVERKKN